MLISISLNSTTPGIPGIPAEQQFATFPVDIGRDSGCDLVLPDASKYVSSRHAQLGIDQGQLMLRDSSSNGTYVNGSTERVSNGDSVALSNGDVVTMGAFRLEITILSSDPVALEMADPQAETIAYRHADASPDAVPTPTASDDNAPAEGTTDTYPVGNASAVDPSAATEHRDLASQEVVREKKPNPLDRLPPQNRIAQLDKKTAATPTDPTQVNIAPTEPRLEAFDHSAQTDSGAMLDTLLVAAGLNPDDFADIDPNQLAEHIGNVLNRSVNSMMLLLRSRDELKNTMRAQLTLLAPNDNNPLRFSVSAEDSLGKLLRPSAVNGFTDANTALDQALRDIKIHQMAMLEATRSALNIVLSHFDPETLANTMRENNPLAANMPLAREAKLWEEFKARYNEIKDDAMEDFSDIFGRELRKAYERSVSELKQADD